MQLTLSLAESRGNAGNCHYPKTVIIANADELKAAIRFDHVCGKFKDGYRSKSNFIESDTIVMDCDNDHSDDPSEWITLEKAAEMFRDICCAIVPSRNHMREKNGKPARPRFHMYFGIPRISGAEDCAALKKDVFEKFSFFDGNALDAARFIFGTDSKDVIWNEGNKTITDIVGRQDNAATLKTGSVNTDPETEPQYLDRAATYDNDPIKVGERNKRLHDYALKVLTRYGICDQARQLYMEEHARCEKPLGPTEVESIWKSAMDYYNNTISKNPDYKFPDEYNSKGDSLIPPDYSDVGEAKVLVREYGHKLKYSDATGFLLYDGKRWVEDKQSAIGAMEEFLDLQLKDAMVTAEKAKKCLIDKGVPKKTVNSDKWTGKDLTEEQRPYYFVLQKAKEYRSFILKHRDFKFVVSTLDAAKPSLKIEPDDLDQDKYLLNTPQATYNLTKGLAGAQPHDPKDLITKMTACSPGDTGSQLWENALETFFCGDAELIEYVQFIAGMAAVGKVYQEHLIIAYGGGKNGKSTFWNVLFRILGTYSGKISAEALTVGCKRNVKPELAELQGKRLVIASELEEGTRLNTAVVKQLCSTDTIHAEKKYKDPFDFTPSHTLVLYTNHLPRVGANDVGIWRRLVVIPFNARITEASDIKNYADHLYEKAGAAIMKWIIEGAQKAISADFKIPIPKCVHDAIQSYHEENNWLGQFIEECCEVDVSYVEKSGELYQLYRAYCMKNGDYTRNKADFYSALDEDGYKRRRTNKGSFVHGLKLKEKPYIYEYIRLSQRLSEIYLPGNKG